MVNILLSNRIETPGNDFLEVSIAPINDHFPLLISV